MAAKKKNVDEVTTKEVVETNVDNTEEVVETSEDGTEEAGDDIVQDALSESDEDSVISENDDEIDDFSDEMDKKIVQNRVYDSIVQRTSRSAYAIEKASKTAKKKMYKSEHVVTENGNEEVETSATIKRGEMLELVASARSNKILKGIISGFREVDTNGEGSGTLLAEVLYGTGAFSVVIPSYLLFDYDMEKYENEENRGAIEKILTKRIGSNVQFVVRNLDEKNSIAYADRLSALSMQGIYQYTFAQRDGKPNIVPGMLVKADVVQVGRTYVVVNALGAEFRIGQSELSWIHIGDANQDFSVGDSVIVRISSFNVVVVKKNSNNYKLIKATGSIKDASQNPRKENYPKYHIGGRYTAEITWTDDSGVFCKLSDNMDCLVAFPKFGKNPVRGERRVVQITQKDDAKLFIYGVFVNN